MDSESVLKIIFTSLLVIIVFNNYIENFVENISVQGYLLDKIIISSSGALIGLIIGIVTQIIRVYD